MTTKKHIHIWAMGVCLRGANKVDYTIILLEEMSMGRKEEMGGCNSSERIIVTVYSTIEPWPFVSFVLCV